MQLYGIRRRSWWKTPEELEAAAAAVSKEVGDRGGLRRPLDQVLRARTRTTGRSAPTASTRPRAREAIRAHAEKAGFGADEINAVADTVIIRPDPVRGSRPPPRGAGPDSAAGISARPAARPPPSGRVAGPVEIPQGPWPAATQRPSMPGARPRAGGRRATAGARRRARPRPSRAGERGHEALAAAPQRPAQAAGSGSSAGRSSRPRSARRPATRLKIDAGPGPRRPPTTVLHAHLLDDVPRRVVHLHLGHHAPDRHDRLPCARGVDHLRRPRARPPRAPRPPGAAPRRRARRGRGRR